MTDEPITTTVLRQTDRGQVAPERYSGEVFQWHWFVYPFWDAKAGKTKYGVAHYHSGQQLTWRKTRAGAAMAIGEFAALPINWGRSNLSDGEWDTIRDCLAKMQRDAERRYASRAIERVRE